MHHITLTPPAHPPSSTDILVDAGVLADIASHTKSSGYDRVVLLADAGIRPIVDQIAAALPGVLRIDVKSGDASKSLAETERITGRMLDAGCTRNTLMVCVGGGMLTDLGGFVASVFMRGIHCVLVPTTLLGMADAAIGGKTAVNAAGRKNMIGTITHPRMVIADTGLLQGLPEPQLCEGLVEIIKIAAITDRPFFEWLEENIAGILKRDKNMIDDCVVRSIEAKVKIVEADTHDRDVRLLLNFGHTVGHAIEALSNYTMSHGNAVSIGMVAEMKLTGMKEADRVIALLKAVKAPIDVPKGSDAKKLWETMQNDKKNERGAVRMAVPVHLGEGAVHELTEKKFLTLFS